MCSADRHRRGVMILAPSSGIRDVHLVAQHVPHHTGLLPRVKRLDGRHALQPVEHLVVRESTPVAAPEHFLKQLPKFTFLHGFKCTQRTQPNENARQPKLPGVDDPIRIRPRPNRDNRRPCAASERWRRRAIGRWSSEARNWPPSVHAPPRTDIRGTLRPFR